MANAMKPADLESEQDRGTCGLYVHIPFCETKCGYCDFFSVPLRGRHTTPLVERVIAELGRRVGEIGARFAVETIFCGGGTPTVLPVPDLARLMDAIVNSVPMDGVSEFTVEANPATVDDHNARLLVASGVNRVSMGAQSFLPRELAELERIHSPADVAPSVATLRRQGVQQINLDLIFGIPGQTLQSWEQSLTCAIALDPDHIACYGLTYEPGTRLTAMRERGRVKPVDEGLEADMYLHAVERLAASGYAQYETSNFARPGCACKHNLIYWRNEPYIGVGPSAAGCIDGRRYKNIADVAGYIRMMDERGHAEVESEVITAELLSTEMIMMQLRLVEGLSISAFRQRIGMDPIALFRETLKRLTELGNVKVTDTHIALTRMGRLVSDAVIRDLATDYSPPDAVSSVVEN